MALAGVIIAAGLAIAILSALTSAISDSSRYGDGALFLVLGISILQAIISLVVSIVLLDGGLQAVRGRNLALPTLFGKITELPNLVGLQIFSTIAVILGLLAFVIPGIYLAVAYVFAGMALVDEPRSFVDALNLSRRLVTPHWFDVTLFMLTVGGVVVLGYLVCLIGAIVSIPVGYCMVAAAYEQLLKLSGEAVIPEENER